MGTLGGKGLTSVKHPQLPTNCIILSLILNGHRQQAKPVFINKNIK